MGQGFNPALGNAEISCNSSVLKHILHFWRMGTEREGAVEAFWVQKTFEGLFLPQTSSLKDFFRWSPHLKDFFCWKPAFNMLLWVQKRCLKGFFGANLCFTAFFWCKPQLKVLFLVQTLFWMTSKGGTNPLFKGLWMQIPVLRTFLLASSHFKDFFGCKALLNVPFLLQPPA